MTLSPWDGPTRSRAKGASGAAPGIAHRPDTAPADGRPVRLTLALVVPIFNDFVSFLRLCRDIDALAAEWNADLSVFGVDDGSLEPGDALRFEPPLRNIDQVRLIRLQCNLGHQRAIAIGLVEVARTGGFDTVLVADSDGEDRPEDFGRLIEAHRSAPDTVVVGRRAKRSESVQFKTFYAIYKALFRVFTGRGIDFGNFVLIPGPLLTRLVNMPETWNHMAAAILRSRLPIRPVPCARGTRYAGTSSMSLVSLLIHGLSAVAVFSDVVFARMLVASGAITLLAVVMAVTAILIRLATDLAVPGWATTVVGISLMMLSEALLFSMMASLMMLQNRSGAPFVPAAHAPMFVAGSVTLFESTQAERDTHATA
jgi:polyisoprenyl-phosphate glycosyltransferase